MAGNWRIRHKLMLGMGLVMAIMGLLLAGTLKGLASYRTTMRTIQSKVAELTEASKLRNCIKELEEQPSASAPDQIYVKSEKVERAKDALKTYEEQLMQSVAGSRDPNEAFLERERVKAVKAGFDYLEQARAQQGAPQVFPQGGKPRQGKSDLGKAIDTLLTAAIDLHNEIVHRFDERIAASERDYKLSLGIVTSTSVIAVLLMASLLRFFYRSVAHPIRDLERGVGRVAKGDFEHRIEVHSGDEVEDLAQAFNDMTDRLREMYRDLAQQVNERSKQLVRSERLAGVGFLAAGVAHEINNPLASIAFCSEALERRLADLFEDARADAAVHADAQEREIVAKYLKMIQDEAMRCKEIIKRLLEFSRSGERRRDQTQLGDLIQVVLDMVQHLPSYKGKEIVFQPAEKVTAWINSQEIQQVLLNLVVNALESMAEGGRLTIEQRQKDGMVELVFKDTGCGMTSEVLDNIFEPFFTRSRTGTGTGLGLSISHRIITQHGGDIEATSAGPNQGSVFTVRLPLKPPANQQDGEMENHDPETEFLKLSSARRERKAA